jgi:hypothetical protein
MQGLRLLEIAAVGNFDNVHKVAKYAGLIGEEECESRRCSCTVQDMGSV